MNKKRIIALFISIGLISQAFISLTTSATTSEAPIYKYDPTTGSYDTNSPLTLNGQALTAPSIFTAPKEQFRTAWVSTVARIDYPSAATYADNVLTLDELKADFITILDRHEEYNLNAVTFQVSPMLDAWYKSDIVPWTQYLTDGAYTSQGNAPVYGEDFDLFQWMISETHKRGIEFHAWFNPYRITNDANDKRSKEEKLADLSDKNFGVKNPDMVLEFQNKLFLDPGRPEVIDFVKARVDEVCSKYDVDAIHFDDYFYPYRYTDAKGNWVTLDTEKAEPIDWNTFNDPKYNRGYTDIRAWRESNVTNLISEISYVIDYHNMDHIKSVQFGVSPFGIWGHKGDETTDTRFEKGSDTPTGSTSSLRDQYANTRDWVDNKWVDYLTPQVYWGFQTTAAPYGEIADWWANTLPWYGVNLYTGHANYKHSQSWVQEFKNPEEIGTQLRFNQKYPTIKGSAFFSLDKLIPRANALPGSANDVLNKSQEVIKEHLSLPANTPGMDWLDRYLTYSIYDLSVSPSDNGNLLNWTDTNEDTQFYCVYRQEGKVDKVDISNPSYMIARFGKEIGTTYSDTTIEFGKDYTYAVTIIDEAGIETSSLSVIEKNIASILSSLPVTTEVTLAHKDIILSARALVDENNIDPSSIDLRHLFQIESILHNLESEQLEKESIAINAIAALPKVEDITLSNEEAIINARTLVINANNDVAITNLDKLVAIELKLHTLKNPVSNDDDDDTPVIDNTNLNTAINAIVAIPTIENLTLLDEALVITARKYVDMIDDINSITNLNKLVAAEEKIIALKEQDQKEKVAIDAISQLPNISEINLTHEDIVKSTRNLVKIANNDSAIINLNKLISIEIKIVQIKEAISLQATKIENAINAITLIPEIDKITLNDELNIKNARALVTVANDNNAITNLETLVKAENKILDLKNTNVPTIPSVPSNPDNNNSSNNNSNSNNDNFSNNGKGDENLPNTGGTAASGVVALGTLLASAGALILKNKKSIK